MQSLDLGIQRIRTWCCHISKKCLTRLGEMILFSQRLQIINSPILAKARQLSILPTELDHFDRRQHYVRIPFIFQRLIC